MKKHLLFLIVITISIFSYGHFPPGKVGPESGISETFPNPAAASTNPKSPTPVVWSGASSTDWNTPGNWVGGIAPLTTDDVSIPTGCSNYPVLVASQTYQCNNLDVNAIGVTINGTLLVDGNLSIASTGKVTVKPGGALTIDTDLSIATNGTLLVENRGSMITNGEASGKATIQRYIPSDMSWHLLSSPVSGQKITNGVFAPPYPPASSFPGNINTWDFYNWLSNCPTPPSPPENWRNLRRYGSNLPNTVDFPQLTFYVTRGYLVAYGSGWATTKEFFGPPINCTQIANFSDVVDVCWALTGNPFPSALNWRLIPDKSNLLSEYYYVWNENKAGGPGYEYWKDDTHYSSTMVDGYIPPMQGFFVRVNPTGLRKLTMANEARAHHNATDMWLKDAPSNRLTLQLGNDTYFDETIVMFEGNSSTGLDQNDAEKMFSLENKIPQVYTIIDANQKTGLNSLPYITNGITVPVGIKTPYAGSYSIKISGIENFSSLTGLSLEDLTENYTQNLFLNPEYSFTASGEENAGRFLLHFAGAVGLSKKDANSIHITSHENIVFITNPGGFRNGQVIISNLLGQEILTQKLTDQTVSQVKLNTVKGYYIVKVQDESTVKTAKVFIN